MALRWQDPRDLLDLNFANSSGFLDGCFSTNQSTVLSGLNFGGIPLVLLLDFCVFIVGFLSLRKLQSSDRNLSFFIFFFDCF